MIDRVSIEVSRRCSKGCHFCYSESTADGDSAWAPAELIAFGLDLARHGVRALSFGGGEPLEYPGMLEVLSGLSGHLGRALTTNGLPLLDPARLADLVAARPDKVHVSIHYPEREAEVERVIATVAALEEGGVPSGVNLLVSRSNALAAALAAQSLRAAGIGNNRIVYLPMRGNDTPDPAAVAFAAGYGSARSAPFQSMTCLAACARSDRFCSIGWDKSVAWCSYTRTRRTLAQPTFAALERTLDGLGLAFCGDDGAVPGRGRLPIVTEDPAPPPAVVLHAAPASTDIPAAHSMDTHWWAVDYDGHVASFNTHEAGPLPTCAVAGDDPDEEALGELAREGSAGRSILDLAGRQFLREGHEHPGRESGAGMLFFLNTLARARSALDAGRAELWPSTGGHAVLSHRISDEEARQLHRHGDCLGCFTHYGNQAEAELGIFTYVHANACENWISGPYGRETIPAQALFFDELPPALKQFAGRVRFGGRCFQEREMIQVVEEFPCHSHQRAYIESLGRTIRPMPGDELSYRELYGERVREQMPEELPKEVDSQDLIWLPSKDIWIRGW